MKTQVITTIAATLFAASVSAADIYSGWGQGNSDLYSSSASDSSVTAVQPGIGSDFDRYHGFADGNPDLFGDKVESPASHSAPADVYKGFAGNPDL